MRIMGLDVGSKTIGVAVSDELQISAQGITTIKWDENDMSSADEALKDIISQYAIKKIVVGLPKHMNGTIGDRGRISQIYANRLEKKFQLKVHLIDERLTTMTAEKTLIERSEEHTSELQSRGHLVCRLLLEKKKKNIN